MNAKTNALKSGSIPTAHDTLEFEETVELSVWMESELDSLEERFADFVTNSTLRNDLMQQR